MYVFQITRTKVEDEECLINEHTFENNTERDYCAQMEGTDRENAIDYLCGGLPKGMFEREGDVLTYKGGYKDYVREWVERIKNCADMMLETPMKGLNELIHTTHYPTETLSQIYDDPNGEEDFAHDMGEWLAFNVKQLKEGDKLYIGGVLYEK